MTSIKAAITLLWFMTLTSPCISTDEVRIFDLTQQMSTKMPSPDLNNYRRDGSLVFNQSGIRSSYSNTNIKMQSFCSLESAGTHMDAPSKVNRNQWSLNQIPADRLVAPLVVIRSQQGVYDSQIHNWERANGLIPEKSVVILDSGWSNYWDPDNDNKKFLGMDSQTERYEYPGFDLDACKILITRKVVGVGTDTLAIDGSSFHNRKYECLSILTDSDIYVLKNLKIPSDLPDSGATIFVGALKMKQATGSPTRILAAVFPNSSSLIPRNQWLLIILSTFILSLLTLKF